ncbi:MAG TPA: hypothetical protein VE713_05670 [Pyrinomonadaceae bacterium]|nr:hypothetical protein [Pyrinomonadaceae bacterium]
MGERRSRDNTTAGERAKARLLRWSPLFVFLMLALPLPAYFLFRYFTATEAVGEYLLLALTSLGLASVFGLLAALAVLFYRKFWERRLRERLAADGVTEGELSWFMSELTDAERRALRQMSARSPLLADAYRETLAARVTAARVLARARAEAEVVERRLRSAAGLPAENRRQLEEDLQKDRARLARVQTEAAEHYRESEVRLQTIEAMADRDASHAETELALQRLGSVHENVPLGLDATRLKQEAREEVERELREPSTPDAAETHGKTGPDADARPDSLQRPGRR